MVVPAYAQSNDIVNRLNHLENEIQTLNRAVYRGGIPDNPSVFPGDGSAQGDAAIGGNIDFRLQQMEQDLRSLTGKVEEQSYLLQQLDQRLNALDTQQATPQPPPFKAQVQQPSYGTPTPYGAPGSLSYEPPAGVTAPGQSDVYSARAQYQTVPQQQEASLPALGGDAAAHYEQAFGVLKGGDYDSAERAFQDFLNQYPDHALAPNATYWLGETYYVRNRYDEAAKIFARSYQTYPNGSKSADSLLKLALSLNGLGNREDACVALKQLEKEFPGGPANVLHRGTQEMNRLQCQ